MTALGRSYLLFNRMETFDELRAKVHAVTAQEVRELANCWYDPAQLTTLVYEPTDEDD